MNPAETPCSIIIPTWNGREILEECLPSVVREMERRENIDELLIVDNASSDGTGDFIAATYPFARVLRLEQNIAIFALNRAARATSHRYMFFLNNDMLLNEGCIDHLLAGFDADDIFAVTGKVLQWDRTTVQAGRRRPVYQRGMFWYLQATGPDVSGITLHALGGQSIFDREKFLALDGLDQLFSPFYHEDLDISWRAFRRGWRVMYDPRAVMIHRGAATAGRVYTREQLDTFMSKNMFLFIWKNLHGPGMLSGHLAWLILRTVNALLKRNRVFLRGLAMAVPRAGAALRARQAAKQSAAISDEDVFALFGPLNSRLGASDDK